MNFLIVFLLLIINVFSVLSDNTKFNPTQIHIALAGKDANGNSNSMAISWNTVLQTKSSTVKYGLNSGDYSYVSTGVSSSYYETFNHHVVLDVLTANTVYYYVVGDNIGGWSGEMSFRSAPLTSNLRGNFSFAVFGDLGVYNGLPSTDYLNGMKEELSFVWHGGDISYADDSFLHPGCILKFCYEETIDTYLKNVEPVASKIPYMTAPGNHEADCHSPACLLNKDRREKLSNFTAYNGRYRMPSSESGGVLNMHYSFNFGNAHFISIDTETGYPGAAEEFRYVLPCGGFGDQLTWLENDLIKANTDRVNRPWIFAIGHHPMYSGDSINKDFQSAMEGLFYKYGVDVYIAGHVHSYERDLPVYQGVPDSNGYNNPLATTHLLIGGAGNDEMNPIQRSKDPSPQEGKGKSKWYASEVDGPWTVITDQDNHVGVGKIQIIDDSNLSFEYIRTTTGEVFDSFKLYRDHTALRR